MAKITFTLLVIFGVSCALSIAFAAVDQGQLPRVDVESQLVQQEGVAVHTRHKRFTCDVLGFLGPGPCIAHCLALQRRGGYCNKNKICICRL